MSEHVFTLAQRRHQRLVGKISAQMTTVLLDARLAGEISLSDCIEAASGAILALAGMSTAENREQVIAALLRAADVARGTAVVLTGRQR